MGKVYKLAKHKRRNVKKQDFSNSLTLLKNGAKAPNMSRRVERAALCAFPTFDKCDSLVFLPVSMARMMNTADVDGLRSLLSSHIHKDFTINYKGMHLTLDPYIQIQDILNQTSPDATCCVHDTKVVDNTIRALLFTKYTENKLIYETAAPVYERVFPIVFSTVSREDRWKKKLTNSRVPEQDRPRLTELASTEAELVVYANVEWVIKFDPDTRKVTHLDFNYYLVAVKDGRDRSAGGLEVLANMVVH